MKKKNIEEVIKSVQTVCDEVLLLILTVIELCEIAEKKKSLGKSYKASLS